MSSEAIPSAQDSPPLRLVVGLGNPGRKYAGTRHNIGFDIVDRLARELGLSWSHEKKRRAEVAKGPDVILVKPQTYMNLSGEAVGALRSFYRLAPEEILVVYDDADLQLGTLRFRASGSAGGHNGVKSLIQHLGTDAFPRLKCGIGRDPEVPGKPEMIGHVLGRFASEDAPKVEKLLERAADAVNCALSRGLGAAMNEFNQKEKQPGKPSPSPPPKNNDGKAQRPESSPTTSDE